MKKEPVEMPESMPAEGMQAPDATMDQMAAPDAVDTQPDNGTAAQIKEIVLKYTPGASMDDQASMDMAVLGLLQKLDNVHEKLLVSVENDPDFGAALSEIFKGGNARTALARAYGPEAFTAVEGDPDFDEMTQSLEQGRKRVGEKRKYAETLKKNQEMSIKEIEAYFQEKSYSEEEAVARIDKYMEIRQDFLDDKLTRKHLELLDKAMDYDKSVQQAEEAGRVAGRNEKIVEKREKLKTASDGLPELVGQGRMPEKPKSFAGKFLDGVI